MFRRLRPEVDSGSSSSISGWLTSGRLTKRRGGTDGGTLVMPSLPLVQQLLDEFGLKHSIDDDGDLTVRWERCTMYFFFSGERGELVRCRAYLNKWYDVDNRGALIVLLDEWNRTRALPKAFTVLPDEGLVGICGEHAHDFAALATREQIKFTVGFWIETLLHFAEWIENQV